LGVSFPPKINEENPSRKANAAQNPQRFDGMGGCRDDLEEDGWRDWLGAVPPN
jgi:hypothetical protein